MRPTHFAAFALALVACGSNGPTTTMHDGAVLAGPGFDASVADGSMDASSPASADGDDPCLGVTCTTPPAPTCNGSAVLTSPVAPGACVAGACVYPTMDLPCATTCSAGACTSLVTDVALGSSHTCALISDGTLRCWGESFDGELGIEPYDSHDQLVPRTPALPGATAIGAGGYFSCAIANGGVRCWGQNDESAQLGLGDGLPWRARPSPTAVTGLGAGATLLAVGHAHACALVNGAVRCWGDNGAGQLGAGNTAATRVPVAAVGLTSGVTKLSAGGQHTCAVVNGGLKCWGSNEYGQLGLGTTTSTPSPTDVPGLTTGVTAVACGGSHTCAIVNGGLRCWGDNFAGQLGLGTQAQQTSPTTVPAFATRVDAVATGGMHTCAIADGALSCWGWGSDGELGIGTRVRMSSPQPVPGFSFATVSVAAGASHTCARRGGRLSCWGYSHNGQVGTGVVSEAITSPAVVPVP